MCTIFLQSMECTANNPLVCGGGGGHIDARRMMANKINMQFEKEAEIHPD